MVIGTWNIFTYLKINLFVRVRIIGEKHIKTIIGDIKLVLTYPYDFVSLVCHNIFKRPLYHLLKSLIVI